MQILVAHGMWSGTEKMTTGWKVVSSADRSASLERKHDFVVSML